MSTVCSARVRIYAKGAEGYLSKEAWGEHDVLRNSFPNYYVKPQTWHGITFPTVELVPEVGCVRPKFLSKPRNQSLSEWTTTGGSWLCDNFLGYPKKLIEQGHAEVNTSWSCRTVSHLPAGARFELVLTALRVPFGHDWDNYPPYITITLADDYRIALIGEESSTRSLVQYQSGGEWWTAGEFNWDVVGDFCALWWDPLAGGLSLSLDWGQTRMCYDCSPDLDRAGLVIPEGHLEIAGQGHAVWFGLNTMYCEKDAADAYFDSTGRGTYEERGGVWVPDCSTWARIPQNCALTGTDRTSSFPAATIGYRVQFSSHLLDSEENSSPIDIYRVPELYAVDMEQAATLVAPLDWDNAGNYTLLDGAEKSYSIEHTVEGGNATGGSAQVQIPWDPNEVFAADYRFRFCRVYLQDWRGTGYTAVFTGEIVDFGFEAAQSGEAAVTLQLVSGYVRAERIKQERHWPPLGGMTTAAARTQWLNLIGLPSTRGTWVATGAVLPKGNPFEPFGAPREGQPAIELLRRIDEAEQTYSYFDLATGQWKNILRSALNTVGSAVTLYSTEATALAGAGDAWLKWLECQVEDQGSEVVTRWKAAGITPSGDYVASRATDWASERQTTSDSFVSYPVLKLAEGEYPDQSYTGLAALALYESDNLNWRRVQVQALEYAAMPQPPYWLYIVGHDLLGDTDPIRVLALRHEGSNGEGHLSIEGICRVLVKTVPD